MTIKLSSYGNSLGTRNDARKIREQILSYKEKAILDFEGLSIVSNSFADELFGIIVAELGIQFLQEKIMIKNTTPEVQSTIKKAIKTRM